eukprot:Plantae.Rhodophyta-Hildenbrandia_rubra.ctg4822.p1 GENE.Plantae.Rhodophyta-Hildenbrandia_rubra.ctg4822~~Plantae.Rhodophyta-Hildenbrandia_rubra.ctg4822.p1  ORF type:complete len:341 (+),score=84.16 Plantae.Rhodophyta-Hildenbrandia_rubra.ctg4822:90-1112(+)
MKPAFVGPVALRSSTLTSRGYLCSKRDLVNLFNASNGRKRARSLSTITSLMGWGEKKNGDGKSKTDGNEGNESQKGNNPEEEASKEIQDLDISDIADEDLANDVTTDETTANDILSSPAFLKKKLEIVQNELVESRKRLDEVEEMVEKEKDGYMRLAADFKNFRRRSEEEMSKQEGKAVAKLCKEFLGVLDAFERASSSLKVETEKEEVIHKSYQAINKQLLEVFAKLEVEAMDSVGQEFDPKLHDAIQRMESKYHPEGVVAQQYQRGYLMGQHLIRPAIVVVSTGPGPEKKDEGADLEEGNSTDNASASSVEPVDVEGDEVEKSGNGTASEVESELKSK